MDNIKKYLAEALGTFTLALVVALSIVTKFPIATPILAGLVLMLFVYSIGHISGAHINPAVTIGLWSIKKIKTNEALAYIVSQFIGAGIALFLVLNGTCIQLIPTTIISIRASFNSKNPAETIIPSIIATGIAAVMGVLYCKILEKFF